MNRPTTSDSRNFRRTGPEQFPLREQILDKEYMNIEQSSERRMNMIEKGRRFFEGSSPYKKSESLDRRNKMNKTTNLYLNTDIDHNSSVLNSKALI